MKKIVKCILPIVSSAALVTPVLASCGQETINPLPSEAFEIEHGALKLNLSFKGWNKYNTLKISSDVSVVKGGGLVAPNGELDGIKHFICEERFLSNFTTTGGLWDNSVGDMKQLEDINFTWMMWPHEGAFIGKYPNLKVIDFSLYDEYDPDFMQANIFNGDNDLPQYGTIYISDESFKTDVEAGFSINVSGQFKDWTVEVKQK